MVSTRTLFGAGLAIIAIVSLAAVVVVQQMLLQKVTTQASSTVSSESPVKPMPTVVINYYGWVYGTFAGYIPEPGRTVLVVYLQIENHGYDRVPIAPNYFYLSVGAQHQQFSPVYIPRLMETVPVTDVLNGLTVKAYVAFSIPVGFGMYSLVYQPDTGSYDVQYVNQGFTTATETT